MKRKNYPRSVESNNLSFSVRSRLDTHLINPNREIAQYINSCLNSIKIDFYFDNHHALAYVNFLLKSKLSETLIKKKLYFSIEIDLLTLKINSLKFFIDIIFTL